MLTTAPYLHVRRPSPTTAEFTVTTCPSLTLTVRLLLGIVFLLRVFLGLSALLLLHSSWTVVPQQQQQQHPQHAYYGSIGGPGGQGQYILQAFPNATRKVAVNGGGNAVAATATATATSLSSAYESNNYQQEGQQYETTQQTSPADNDNEKHAVIPVGASPPIAATVEAQEQQQQLVPVIPRPDTLYTTAWALYLLQEVHASPPGQLIANLAQRTLPPSLIFPLCLLLLYLTTQRIHTTESLLVLRGLGIQTSSTGGNYLHHWPFEGGKKTRFIPTEKIRDVLINEAFRGFGVRYYLVVVVDGEEDVVVVFPGLLPRKAIVERVWRGVRGCLWEPQDGYAVGMAGGGGNGVVGRRAVGDKTSSTG